MRRADELRSLKIGGGGRDARRFNISYQGHRDLGTPWNICHG